MTLTAADILPDDACAGALVGRVQLDDGPHVIAARDAGLFDLSHLAPTMSDLVDLDAPAAAVRGHAGERLMDLDEALARRALLAPCDLAAIKAAGVTFADSLVERVIEERAKGDRAAAERLRAELVGLLGGSLTGLKPGSPAAMQLKAALIERGLWSQYLEVGIGPDAEVFTKAQPMSAVGCGAEIGLHPKSEWNNPEPEIVLACSSRGEAVGAALGNDVNLRDFEGRSALLLSKAKDNNASCAIGPFIRLFDTTFGIDDVRRAQVRLEVTGRDQFRVAGENAMDRISRDPLELVAATCGPEHQYPDGLMLFLGTMYVPTADRRGPGQGFTHEAGDVVRISSGKLGALVNTVTTSNAAPPWTFGARALMRSLAARGLLLN
ncbi:MAG TPA: fumarylacetoacetate hydrolase family protein [Caulobacteraceae bacterium]|nr:fumarylacetoacetate hydrolase family protein [Caulobacteraceae bacterium]